MTEIEQTGISKAQFITWIITVSLFTCSILLASYTNINARVKALELDMQATKIRVEQNDKALDNILIKLENINTTVMGIDKKVTIIEYKN